MSRARRCHVRTACQEEVHAAPVPSPRPITNWSGHHVLAAADAVRAPAGEAELCALLARDRAPVRVIGNRFSHGRMLAAAGEGLIVDVSRLRGLLAVTPDEVTVASGTPLAELFATLQGMGRVLPCSPGVISAQTLAGALSTGTHGQGLRQSALADVVTAFRVVGEDGAVWTCRRGDPAFPALQLGLGCLGVITAVTLRTAPARLYTCLKRLASAELLDSEFLAHNEAYPFCKAWWFPQTEQVHLWLVREATVDEADQHRAGGGELVALTERDRRLDATIAGTLRRMADDTGDHALRGDQFRTVTRFHDFTDVVGDIYQILCKGIPAPQVNVEIAVPLRRFSRACARLRRWAEASADRMHYPIILRCTGGSPAWLSPTGGEPVCYFGFVVYLAGDGTPAPEGIEALHQVEELLLAEEGRPHWGKHFRAELYRWAALYPRWTQFCRLRASLDPCGRFLNPFLRDLMAT